MQGIRRDHGIGEIADAVTQHRKHRDLMGLARHVDLAEHEPAAVIAASRCRASCSPPAEPRTVLPSMGEYPMLGERCGALGGPNTDRAIQLVTIQPLQGASNGRLTRRAAGTQRRKDLIRRVGRYRTPPLARVRHPRTPGQ
jgi:hypothetical protein